MPKICTNDFLTVPSEPWVTSNLEVYCYLKARLPYPYRIESEPSTNYFSEWKYAYRVFKGETELAFWQGDFRELGPSELCECARVLWRQITSEEPW
ncbi:MAG: hypothetical protein O2931_11890 [Planctomycetota bacterium]|nr:hypothetical protein [Planctomycetota bacterium]MDA1179488.1 hypothetical protein [Planctomycetota bacterium]